MQLDESSRIELATAAFLFLGLCWMIYLMVRNHRADAKDRVPPPVRIGLLQRVRTALNPGKLRMAAWPPGEATVEQVYLIPPRFYVRHADLRGGGGGGRVSPRISRARKAKSTNTSPWWFLCLETSGRVWCDWGR